MQKRITVTQLPTGMFEVSVSYGEVSAPELGPLLVGLRGSDDAEQGVTFEMPVGNEVKFEEEASADSKSAFRTKREMGALDGQGRMLLRPFLLHLARQRSEEWLSVDDVYGECVRLGWASRGDNPRESVAAALKTATKKGRNWIEAEGVRQNRRYRLRKPRFLIRRSKPKADEED